MAFNVRDPQSFHMHHMQNALWGCLCKIQFAKLLAETLKILFLVDDFISHLQRRKKKKR